MNVMDAMDDEVRKVLEVADDILSDPERWTQQTEARSIDGHPVLAESPEAVTFCAVGAVRRAGDLLYPKAGTEDGHRDRTLYKALYLLGAAAEETSGSPSSCRTQRPSTIGLTGINDGPDPQFAYQQIRQVYAKALGSSVRF